MLAIFDLDGTLFNTNDVNYYAYKQALKEFGFDLDYDYFCKECNGKHYKIFLPQIATDEEEIMELIHERKMDLYKTYLGSAKVNTHLFNLLETMKNNYYIALVTTASKRSCYDIIEKFDKIPLFDLILTQEDVKKVKPNPEGFLKAMNYFSMKPENTIIFEDSNIGIEAARETGSTVLVVDKF